jgi:hypothetical protein
MTEGQMEKLFLLASSLVNSNTARGFAAASATIGRDISGSSTWLAEACQQPVRGFVR